MISNSTLVLSADENRYRKEYINLSGIEKVKYGEEWDMVCSTEEYIRLHDYIKNIKEKYFKLQVSPLEKLIIAYDIVKSKQYNLSGDAGIDGLPHNVVFGEYINCRGYCSLMKEILTGEGIEIKNQNIEVYDKKGNLIDYHARLTVLLNDDKYGIYGIYSIDPTDDSYKEEYKTTLSPNITPTDLYCSFLTPIVSHHLYHTEDMEFRLGNISTDKDIDLSKKSNFNINESEQLQYLISSYSLDELSIMNDITFYGILSKIPQESLIDYINARYIDLELLMKAVSNARIIEGYNIEQLHEEISRIYSINEPFYYSENQNIIEM